MRKRRSWLLAGHDSVDGWIDRWMEGWMVGVQEFRSQQSWTSLSFQHVDRFLFQDHKFQYFLFMANFPHWATGACFLRRLCFASPNRRRFHSIHKYREFYFTFTKEKCTNFFHLQIFWHIKIYKDCIIYSVVFSICCVQ